MSNEPIQRWHASVRFSGAAPFMHKADDGSYVRFADHVRVLAETRDAVLDEAIAAIEGAISSMRERHKFGVPRFVAALESLRSPVREDMEG